MKSYPYLAQYNATSEYVDVVLWVTEPHRGLVVYIPTSGVLPEDPRAELTLFEVLSPANSEIAEYTGSVVLRSDTDPVLDD